MRPEDRQAKVPHLVTPEIVTLPREIDINNAASVCNELTRALAEPTTVLIADMSLTEFCDSTGIQHLLIADMAARMRGVELRLVVQSRSVLQLMRTLSVDKVLKIYDSKLAAFAPTPSPASPERRSMGRFRRARTRISGR